ncbi:type II toxin-antitoxin system VapC family toxin [Deinococcus aestuarii]|uniref:type II toxin-antitoxin system VapC family toxin n=1 Tax=Deinococcus aestuarii TaxID=2774531 RepID=UPI001C0B7EFB
MTVALDTNILVDLWANTVQGQLNAQTLHRLQTVGHPLCICGAVYAELHAIPGISKADLDATLTAMRIAVDPVMSLPIWDEAGRVHAALCERRRLAKVSVSQRPLIDHLVGAHALHRTGALLTLNTNDFRDFAALTVIQA